ncbi:MAG TPA: hypothetical protein VNL37_05835, partial [Candidatus Polarisedimenticolia bacterium]|nr:hypothetical protein [Candidatus Polarisedimenticolia bacterium]
MKRRGDLFSSRAATAALACLFATLAACTNKEAVLGVVTAARGPTVTLSGDVQPILTASCATAFCHGSPLAAPMSLRPGDSYASLVGASSCEAPTFLRVEAGNSAASYLVIKLEGTQSALSTAGACTTCSFGAGSVNGCGGQMPLTGPPFLPDAEIELIRSW